MIRLLPCIVAAFLAANLLEARPPAPKGKGNAIKGWGFFVDPDKDCEFAFQEGVLTLKVPATPHEMQLPDAKRRQGKETTRLNAPRVVQPVKGDFTLTLDYPKFTIAKGTPAVEGESPCVSAGIFVWKDDSNFVRIARFQNTANKEGGKLQLNGYKGGQLLFEWPKESQDVAELKIERAEGKLGFHYRAKDGTDWLSAGKGKFDFDGEVQVGVIAGNRTTAPFTATFSGLKLEEK